LVTAEGIEDSEQVATVLALECDLVQGYLFGRPCPKAEAKRVARQSFGIIGQTQPPAPVLPIWGLTANPVPDHMLSHRPL